MSRRLLTATFFVSLAWVTGAYSAGNAAAPQPAAQAPAADPAPTPAPAPAVPATAGVDVAKASTQPSGISTIGDAIGQIQPYRTFIDFQRYNMESNGEPNNPISNVRLTVTFPNGNKVILPEGSQWWPIGNGQAQEIHRMYELPFSYIVNDGFKFTVQMERKGSPMLPCQFDIVQLSQFNRAYTCHTDLTWQQSKNIPAENLDKEGIQIRIFTSKNSEPKEIPSDALAIR
jgi:hypothetical protein